MRLKRVGATALAFGLAGVVSVLTVVPGLAASSTVVVWPGDKHGWDFFTEGPTGSGAFVNGPASPPLGTGSANLVVDSTGREILATAAYGGTPLSSIQRLEYSTYRTSGDPALAVSLQFDIDYDSTDAITSYQGRLVYEPYFTQTVQTGTWQTWNTLTGSPTPSTTTGNWWFSRPPGNLPANCPQSDPCTWAEVLQKFPNIAVFNGGGTIFRAGGPWAGGFNGNVDAFTIGIGGNTTTYDFELHGPTPQSKEDCKDGGYKNFVDDNNQPFKNQGQCVSYVATGGKH